VNVKAKGVPVSRVVEECSDRLGLRLLNQGVDLNVDIKHAEIGRPGLALTGFVDGFLPGHIQILGEVEIRYLEALDGDARVGSFRGVLQMGVPCIIIAGDLSLPDPLLDISTSEGVPVISTPVSPTETIQYLNSYLLTELAPETNINGTLVDVYGVGILIKGKSGIGKSECALDLAGRGHRLVADDLVRVIAKSPGILIGRSSGPLQSFVEVRGIGLVDIGTIFGVRALRRQKRIEIQVDLKEWEKGLSYDRSGLESGQVEILGVQIPSTTVPLVPGKNVSVIVEVIALTHTLKAYGYDAADVLNRRWIEHIESAGRADFEAKDIE
jgi:HPr kinase/phosphorylase